MKKHVTRNMVFIGISALMIALVFIGFAKTQPAVADHLAIASSKSFASHNSVAKNRNQ